MSIHMVTILGMCAGENVLANAWLSPNSGALGRK
jgi:hypothetical protein